MNAVGGATRRVPGAQALDRAVAILNSFSPERPELGVSELARMTGLTRSTAHRLLSGLHAHGLVQQVPGSAKYTLGPHLLRLARIAGLRADLPQLARPAMVELRDQVGETVGLHVLSDERHRKVIDQVESHHALRRTYTDLDEPIPIHHGAPGKVLLAYLDTEIRESVLAGELEVITPKTPHDPDALREELTRIREFGHALSYEERVEGITSLGVPIFDHSGRAAACFSVSGPSTRLTPERLQECIAPAKRAAASVSALLGARSAR